MILLSAKLLVDLPATKTRYYLFLLPAVALLAALGLRQLQRLVAAPGPDRRGAARGGRSAAAARRSAEVDGHNRDWAVGPMLDVAAASGIPAVAANPQAIRLINAATYPQTRLSESVDPHNTRYAIVVERIRYATSVPNRFVFYRRNGPWSRCCAARSIRRWCSSSRARWPPSRADGPEPDELGKQLSAATGDAISCSRVDELAR